MRICYKFSGEQVAELEQPDARSIVFGSWLKKHIASSVGVSRFRVLVFGPDNTVLPDGPIYEVLPDQLDIVIQSKTYRDHLQIEVDHLFDCAWMENVGLVEELLLSRIDPNVTETETGKTLLQIAASTNNSAMTELLLEAEADPDQMSYRKFAPLHTAARLGHTETLDILLKSNANVNIDNGEGLTPLFLAVQCDEYWEYKFIEACRILIEGRADVNSRYKGNKTPLFFAADNPSYRIMYYLLEARADVNAVNSERQTPLHVVTLQYDLEGVKMLLDYSASLEAMDARGLARELAETSPPRVGEPCPEACQGCGLSTHSWCEGCYQRTEAGHSGFSAICRQCDADKIVCPLCLEGGFDWDSGHRAYVKAHGEEDQEVIEVSVDPSDPPVRIRISDWAASTGISVEKLRSELFASLGGSGLQGR
eukprot:s3063_g6.t1